MRISPTPHSELSLPMVLLRLMWYIGGVLAFSSTVSSMIPRAQPPGSQFSGTAVTTSPKLPICPTPYSANSSTPLVSPDLPPLQLWTLSDWSTDYTLPDGGSIIFRLRNTLTGYDALCFRRGLYPEGYCLQAITDGKGEGEGEGEGQGSSSSSEEDTTGTIFQYYDKIGLLQVYQEWDCAESDG